MWLEENCLLWSEQKWKEQFTLLLLVLHRTLIRQDTLKCSKKCVCACGGDLNIFSFTSCWICLTPGGWWPPTTIAIRPHGTTPTQPQMDLHQRRAASEFCQLRWELMEKKELVSSEFYWSENRFIFMKETDVKSVRLTRREWLKLLTAWFICQSANMTDFKKLEGWLILSL